MLVLRGDVLRERGLIDTALGWFDRLGYDTGRLTDPTFVYLTESSVEASVQTRDEHNRPCIDRSDWDRIKTEMQERPLSEPIPRELIACHSYVEPGPTTYA